TVDTRTTAALAANTTLTVHLGDVEGVPDAPFIAALNFTVLGTSSTAAATLYTCGTTPPVVPSRSIDPGWAQSLAMVVATDANGDVCVVVDKTAHVLVDVFGAFATTADIHPITSTRIRDTRSGAMPGAGAVLDQQITGTNGVPTDPFPTAAIVTVTLTSPQNIGYASAFPCVDGIPPTSIVNVVPNRSQSNGGVVPFDGAGRLCVFISVPSHVLIDLSGWKGTAFTPLPPARLFDSRAL
ncbi:MAG TPA: hypothetical protein DCR14_17420, partial [Acidimicrobiaceae bacterium]|nr:hypothetical protein [Acidimicrobiaceae bacterium]